MDPVHGDIGLSELEINIIATPTFQRLRRLKQLGFASYVYPNASYSRFAHSLGVLHIASRVADVFHQNDLINDEAVTKLRIAALLHDIGHYPYSHLMEYIEKEQTTDALLIKKGEGVSTPKKVRVYPSHDDLGELIVTERKDIKELIENHDIDPEEISALMKGQHTQIPNILHKSLDVDRLDYLVRDSFNTGLPYGRVDLNYILNNLEITKEEGEIVLRTKARISAEHLLLARYFMFSSVYSHKTIFGFEELVRNTIDLLIQKDEIYRSGDDIERMIKSDTSDFLCFDDSYLDSRIEKYAYSENNDILNIFCRTIKHRCPPKLVYEVIDLQQRDRGDPSTEYTLFRQFLRQKLFEKANEFEITPELLYWREPKDIDFEAASPFIGISHLHEVKSEEMHGLVKLIDSDGKIINLVEEKNSIIHYLSQLQFKSIRLYAVGVGEDKLQRLRQAINNHIQAS